MDWRRVKSILIALLLVTNLLLGVNIYSHYAEQQRRSQETIRTALRLMGNDSWGVTHEMAAALPSTMRYYQAERDLEAESRFAESLLGRHVTAQVHGGGVYEYSSPLGSLWLRGGMRLEITLLDPPGTLEECAARLKAAGLDLKSGEYRETGADAAVAVQQVNGYRIDNCSLELWLEEGAFTLQGQWVLSEQRRESTAAATRTELLLALGRAMISLNKPREALVLSIDPGYLAESAGTRETGLQPVWFVETTHGAFYINVTDETVVSY